MGSPTDRKYTETHEWIMLSNPARTGITEYRVKQLGTITGVTLPPKAEDVTQGQVIGAISGVNTSHSFHSPANGHIGDHNEILLDTPGAINLDPYKDGWIMEITPSNVSQLDGLLTAAAYDEKYPLQ